MFIKPKCSWEESKGSGLHQWIKQKEVPQPDELHQTTLKTWITAYLNWLTGVQLERHYI